jgi:hypothetical protein
VKTPVVRSRGVSASIVAASLALVAGPSLAVGAPAAPEPGVSRPEPPLWSSLSVAASYGGAVRSHALWDGPGLILAVDEPRWVADPEVWVEGRWVLPQAWDQPSNVVRTISARAGVSARVSSLGRLGVGMGFDRESINITTVTMDPNAGQLSSTRLAPNYQPAARVFGRLVSLSWHGFAASATLFLDAVHSPDPQNTFRGGVSVEGWWRSRGN